MGGQIQFRRHLDDHMMFGPTLQNLGALNGEQLSPPCSSHGDRKRGSGFKDFGVYSCALMPMESIHVLRLA